MGIHASSVFQYILKRRLSPKSPKSPYTILLAYIIVCYDMYPIPSRAYLVSAYSTVWYGMYLSGHILYLRPSISRLSTSARPPRRPSLYIIIRSCTIIFIHTNIYQFLPAIARYISVRKSSKKSWQELFFNFKLFAGFCSSGSRSSTVDIVVSFWFCSLTTTPPSLYIGGWYRYEMTFATYLQQDHNTGCCLFGTSCHSKQ